jgi:hypothetical protein
MDDMSLSGSLSVTGSSLTQRKGLKIRGLSVRPFTVPLAGFQFAVFLA